MWILPEYEGSIYIRDLTKVNIETQGLQKCALSSYLGDP